MVVQRDERATLLNIPDLDDSIPSANNSDRDGETPYPHVRLLGLVITALLTVLLLIFFCTDHVCIHDLNYRHFGNPFPDIRPFQSIPWARQSIAFAWQAWTIWSASSLATANQQWQVNGFSLVYLLCQLTPQSSCRKSSYFIINLWITNLIRKCPSHPLQQAHIRDCKPSDGKQLSVMLQSDISTPPSPNFTHPQFIGILSNCLEPLMVNQ